MNKICTTVEQSKKLIELGININTADMLYSPPIITHYDESDEYFRELPSYKVINTRCNIIEDNKFDEPLPIRKDDISAWTLSTLLGMMPKLYEEENDPDDGGCQPNLCKGWDNNQWHIVYRPSIYITEWYDDPIDAAFEMVCWLLENGKI